MSAARDPDSGRGDDGGINRGVAYALLEIDYETLPDGDVWPEVRRRIDAWRAGRDGWRTGEIAATIDDFGGEGE